MTHVFHIDTLRTNTEGAQSAFAMASSSIFLLYGCDTYDRPGTMTDLSSATSPSLATSIAPSSPPSPQSTLRVSFLSTGVVIIIVIIVDQPRLRCRNRRPTPLFHYRARSSSLVLRRVRRDPRKGFRREGFSNGRVLAGTLLQIPTLNDSHTRT